MTRIGLLIVCLCCLAGCGGTPTTPSPLPESRPPTLPPYTVVTVTLTDTLSGATLGQSVHNMNTLPALLTFSAPGHVTRTAAIRSASQTVDLIPEAGFDLAFYRQLARNGYESPNSLAPLRLLFQAPSIYLQRTGLSDAQVAALEHATRMAVSDFSGGRLTVVSFESGDALPADRLNWITVELVPDADGACGRASLGAAFGHIWLSTNRPGCTRPLPHTLAHEIGHALGFYHVDGTAALMSATRLVAHNGQLSAAERTHAAIAYHRSSGNRDIDVDSLTPGLSASARIVVD